MLPPTSAVPSFAPYLFSYGGLGFGNPKMPAPGGPGGDFQLISASGLDVPALRVGDASRPRDQGEFIGLNLLGGRDVSIDLAVMPWVYSSTWAARQALQAACTPAVITESALYYRPPESNAPTLACMARATKFNWALDTLALQGVIPTKPSAVNGGIYHAAMMFHATDPRWYAAPTLVSSPILPGGSVTLNNTGTFEMRPVLTVTGPVRAPAIRNSTLGVTLTFTNSGRTGTYDLNAGDSLTVDLDSHSVKAVISGATVSVPNWLVTGSVWWNLPPGNNTVNFTAGASAIGAQATVTWAPAYLTA